MMGLGITRVASAGTLKKAAPVKAAEAIPEETPETAEAVPEETPETAEAVPEETPAEPEQEPTKATTVKAATRKTTATKKSSK